MGAPLNPVPRAEITPRATLTAPWQAWFNQLYTFVAMPAAAGGGVTPATRKINTTYPITGGGALSSDLTLALAAGGISNGFLAQMAAQTLKGNVNATAATPQDLTGTQVTTLLSLFTSTLQGVVPASGGGTVDFLRADGTWSVPAYPSGANPTSLVGLSAINGVSTQFMRSDAAPALNQGIAPTWTGNHIFTGTVDINDTSVANALIVSAGVGVSQMAVQSNNTNQQSSDLSVSRTASTANSVNNGPNYYLSDTGAATATTLQHAGGQTELWQYNGSWAQILKVTTGLVAAFLKPVSIGAPGSGAQFSVVSGNANVQRGGGISVWDTTFSLFGPNAASTSGANLALGYDTTAGTAAILALTPGVAWNPMRLYGSAIALYGANGTECVTFDSVPTTGTATPTMTANKPGSNSGTAKWIPVTVGGTRYYLPLWS